MQSTKTPIIIGPFGPRWKRAESVQSARFGQKGLVYILQSKEAIDSQRLMNLELLSRSMTLVATIAIRGLPILMERLLRVIGNG